MTGNHDPFDANLKRLFESALNRPRPEFQEQLVRDVLAEVSAQRRLRETASARAEPLMKERAFAAFWRGLLSSAKSPLWRQPVPLIGAATIVMLAAAGIWLPPGRNGDPIGQAKRLYGFVAIQDRSAFQTMDGTTDLKSGQRLRTQAGSRAEILLPDASRLVPEPRTTLQIARSRHGSRILLEQGAFHLEAAKQPPGKAIQIEASSARITVLGTRLVVRVVEKPSGTRQSRVRVFSGRVEMESGGQKLLLPAGTEGVAEPGEPPTRSSMVFEVNDLTRLFNQAQTLAAASGRPGGLPAIFDLTTGTLWTVVPGHRLQPGGTNAFMLKLKRPAFGVGAFTLDGAEIPTVGSGQTLRLDVSGFSPPQIPDYLILKVPGVGGLLREIETGFNECSLSGAETDQPTLLEFHLPGSARLHQVNPGAIATRHDRDRLIVTVLARVQLPQIYE